MILLLCFFLPCLLCFRQCQCCCLSLGISFSLCMFSVCMYICYSLLKAVYISPCCCCCLQVPYSLIFSKKISVVLLARYSASFLLLVGIHLQSLSHISSSSYFVQYTSFEVLIFLVMIKNLDDAWIKDGMVILIWGHKICTGNLNIWIICTISPGS